MSNNDSERIFQIRFPSTVYLHCIIVGKKTFWFIPAFLRENFYVILELRNAAGYDYELRWNSIPTVL